MTLLHNITRDYLNEELNVTDPNPVELEAPKRDRARPSGRGPRHLLTRTESRQSVKTSDSSAPTSLEAEFEEAVKTLEQMEQVSLGLSTSQKKEEPQKISPILLRSTRTSPTGPTREQAPLPKKDLTSSKEDAISVVKPKRSRRRSKKKSGTDIPAQGTPGEETSQEMPYEDALRKLEFQIASIRKEAQESHIPNSPKTTNSSCPPTDKGSKKQQ